MPQVEDLSAANKNALGRKSCGEQFLAGLYQRLTSRGLRGKLTTVAELPSDSELTDWIREAMVLNEQGVKLPPRKSEGPKAGEIPEAFLGKLAANPQVKAIFDCKSTSFQKEYNVWIDEAKNDATRDKRIDEALAWVTDGKGRFWKYSKPG